MKIGVYDIDGIDTNDEKPKTRTEKREANTDRYIYRSIEPDSTEVDSTGRPRINSKQFESDFWNEVIGSEEFDKKPGEESDHKDYLKYLDARRRFIAKGIADGRYSSENQNDLYVKPKVKPLELLEEGNNDLIVEKK